MPSSRSWGAVSICGGSTGRESFRKVRLPDSQGWIPEILRNTLLWRAQAAGAQRHSWDLFHL